MLRTGTTNPVYMINPRMNTAEGVSAWTSERDVDAMVRNIMDMTSVQVMVNR